ncbi:MAG TPA: polysaccharide deacetylase family protein [Ktedonobacterales bacterium]
MAGRGGRVRPLVAACLYYSGVVGLVRWWTQRQHGPRLVILNYHRASHPNLRRQLLYLRRHYRLLPLEAALAELYQSGQAGAHAPPHAPARSPARRRTALAITFDDGYRDTYTHAFALARELQIPLTIFLIPSYVETGEPFWWLEGKRLAQQTHVNAAQLGGQTYRLAQQADARATLAGAIDARVRRAGSVSEREAFLKATRTALAVSADPQSADEALARPLSWAEVREMAASGWMSFGAHTQHHPVLAQLADAEEVAHEVGDCRLELERQLGHPVQTFAYPLGKPEHIGPQALQAAQQAGYRWALTTVRGVNTPQTDPYLLHRIGTNDDDHWLVTAAQASGVWMPISRPKTKARLPRR